MRLTHCCDSVAPLQNVGSKIILYPLYGVGVRSHFFWENRSQESLFRKKWSDSEHCRAVLCVDRAEITTGCAVTSACSPGCQKLAVYFGQLCSTLNHVRNRRKLSIFP